MPRLVAPRRLSTRFRQLFNRFIACLLFVQHFLYLLQTEALVNVPAEKTCLGLGALFAPSDERPA